MHASKVTELFTTASLSITFMYGKCYVKTLLVQIHTSAYTVASYNNFNVIFTDVFNLTSGDVQSITNQLASNGIDFSSNRFVDFQLTLPVKSIWIINGLAQCFQFSVQVSYQI